MDCVTVRLPLCLHWRRWVLLPAACGGVNLISFKQELEEEAPLEHRPALRQEGPDVAAGSCFGEAEMRDALHLSISFIFMGQLLGDLGGPIR